MGSATKVASISLISSINWENSKPVSDESMLSVPAAAVQEAAGSVGRPASLEKREASVSGLGGISVSGPACSSLISGHISEDVNFDCSRAGKLEAKKSAC